MAKILVTGGAGFIGSNLAIELEKQGNDVAVIDNLFTGNMENLKGFKGKFVKMDVSKNNELNKLNEKFDIIFHEAAITDPRHGNDEETLKSNISGFNNILDFAKKMNAKLVYASSASMYGNGPVPMKEEQKKEILSAYAKSKLANDETAEKNFEKMHIVGLRYFNVFGINESGKGRPASMVYHLMQQVKSGKNPRIFKWGEQKRDHIYVKDAVNATIKAAYAKKSCVCNVGTGTATSFNELVSQINKAMGTNLKPEYFDSPYGDEYQNNTQADTKKAKTMIGFKAEWKLIDAIKDYARCLYG